MERKAQSRERRSLLGGGKGYVLGSKDISIPSISDSEPDGDAACRGSAERRTGAHRSRLLNHFACELNNAELSNGSVRDGCGLSITVHH